MSATARPNTRTVFLTGASSGIGRETALHLAREGHRLALCARRGEMLAALVEELRGGPPVGRPEERPGERRQESGGDRSGDSPGNRADSSQLFLALPADVTDIAQIEPAVRLVEDRLGPVDTLVYCAGAARFHSVEETTEAIWREMMSANLDGLFLTVRSLLPLFRRIGRGHVVAVLSIAARHGFAGSSAYTAAKFGALGFLESLRAETRSEGIHVTAVIPGATDTPIWDTLGSGWNRSKMMQPEQVARVITSVLRETTTGMIEEIRILPVGGSL